MAMKYFEQATKMPLPSMGREGSNAFLRITSYNVCYTKLLRVAAVSRGQDSFAGIREYRRGDSMRHIHWRASARRDEWIVREYEQVENAELVLVLNTCRRDNVITSYSIHYTKLYEA